MGICVQCSDTHPCQVGVCRPHAGYTCGCDVNLDCNEGTLICNEVGICTACHQDEQCDPGFTCDLNQNKCTLIDENDL